MNNFNLNLSLLYNDELFNFNVNSDYEDDLFCIEFTNEPNIFKVNFYPKVKDIYLKKVSLNFNYNFDGHSFYCNGYQSWTDSCELNTNSKIHSLNYVPKFLDNIYAFSSYGDYNFVDYQNKKGCFHSHNYTYWRTCDNQIVLIGSLNETNFYTIFYYDIKANQLTLKKDITNYLVNNKLTLYNLYYEKHYHLNNVVNNYFKKMKIKNRQTPSIIGYTSWYNHYQNINQETIKNDLVSISQSKIKFNLFQIDDGYESKVGDWLDIDENKFPNGLKVIVDEIHQKGLLAGIWIAPFVCEKDSKLFKEHPDWLLKDENNRLIKAGHNWSKSYALNFYHSEVQKYLKKVLLYYKNELNFDFFKLDFLYAISLQPTINKSRSMIMQDGLNFLRGILKDKLILGCGVPLFNALGLVDYCRIGTDMGLDIDGSLYLKLFHRERVSTKNSVLNTIYRNHLNQKGFKNDPDVFLLRDNIKLNNNQKLSIMIINILLNDVIFTSDDVGKYSKSLEIFINKVLENKSKLLSISKLNNKILLSFDDYKFYYDYQKCEIEGIYKYRKVLE